MQRRWYAREQQPLRIAMDRPSIPDEYWTWDINQDNAVLFFPRVSHYGDWGVDQNEAKRIVDYLTDNYQGDRSFVDFANAVAPNFYQK